MSIFYPHHALLDSTWSHDMFKQEFPENSSWWWISLDWCLRCVKDYLYVMAVTGFFRYLTNMLMVMPTVTCSVNVTDFQTMAATEWNLEMHPFQIMVNTCAAYFFFFLGANFKHQSTKKHKCMLEASTSSSSNCSGIKPVFCLFSAVPWSVLHRRWNLWAFICTRAKKSPSCCKDLSRFLTK